MRGRGVRRLGALLAPLAVLAALLAPAHASVSCTATGTLDFSGAASPCAVAADLCTSCLTAITAPMVTAGMDGGSAAEVDACLTAYDADFTSVASVTAAQLAACAAPSPPPPPPSPPVCSVGQQDFTSASTPCADPATACASGCATAIAMRFILAGVAPSNTAMLSICINAQAAKIIADGVPQQSLVAISACPSPPPPPRPPFPPPPLTCPIVAQLSFTAAVSPCADVANACTTCATALATPFVYAGVSATDATLLGVCITSQAAFIAGDGVNMASVQALASCPAAPPPSPPPLPPPLPPFPPPVVCPVSSTLSFTSAVTPCANTANACTTCVTALATVFVFAGVPASNTAAIGACISAYAVPIMNDGVSGASLAALSSCPAAPPPSPPPTPPPRPPFPPPVVCPVSGSGLSYASAVTPCADASTACTTCVTALATVFVLAGVPTSNTAALGACISTNAGSIAGAGVNVASLTALASCPAAPPPSPPPLPPPRPPFPPPVVCPVSGSGLSYASAVTPCADASTACTTCVTALATVFVLAGVPASNTAALGACISTNAGSIAGAGVNVASLTALASCPAAPPPSPPPLPPPRPPFPPPVVCPVSGSGLSYASAVTPCADASTACTVCVTALATVFVMAGVPASDTAALGVCISTSAGAIVTAGVNVASLTALASCPAAPPPSPPPRPPPSPPPLVCSVSAAQDFSAAATPCANTAAACTTCVTALATPFVIAGVLSSDKAMLGACISSQAAGILAAGVPMASLVALGSCPAPSPPPAPPPSPPPPTCPVSAAQNFSAAVAPCSNVANACTTCVTALATPFVMAGVSSSDGATLGACISAQASVMFNAGVSAASLNALNACPKPSPPPPSPAAIALGPLAPPPPPSSCPLRTVVDFTGAVVPCAPGSDVCTACMAALAAPVIASGVSHADGATIRRCFQTHTLDMLAVGVPLATLASMSACVDADYVQPAPPAVTLTRNSIAPLPPPAKRLAPNADSHAERGARKALATALAVAGVAMLAIGA